jgi:hypothetical protein
MVVCEGLGFTLANVSGVADIKPRAGNVKNGSDDDDDDDDGNESSAREEAEIAKEMLVRETCLAFLKKHDIPAPTEILRPTSPPKFRAKRVIHSGRLETENREIEQKKIELAEYNRAMTVLREQARKKAVTAGQRVFAALTGGGSIDAGELDGSGEESD